MANRDRIPEIHFYEWNITRWLSSGTRIVLTATGRGIFRELLDICYTQGSIPKDPQIQASYCNCSQDELALYWPIIQKHFIQDPRDKTRLINKYANLYRKSFFSLKKRQQLAGKRGGRPEASGKSNAVNDIKTPPETSADYKNTILNDTKLHDSIDDPPQLRPEWHSDFYKLPVMMQEQFLEIKAAHPKGTNLFEASQLWAQKVLARRIVTSTLPIIRQSHDIFSKDPENLRDNARYSLPLDKWIGNEHWNDRAPIAAVSQYQSPYTRATEED